MKKLFALCFLVCLTGFLSAPFVLANEVRHNTELASSDVIKATEVVFENQVEFVNPSQTIVDVRKENQLLAFNDANFVDKSDFRPIHFIYWRDHYKPFVNSNPSLQEDNPLEKERNK